MTITQIVSLVYLLTNTNSSSFPAADMLLSINNAYERVASLIMQSDGRWEWDDSNNTSVATYSQNLVSGTGTYDIPTTHLKLLRVEALDASGHGFQLTPFDQADVKGIAMTEFMSVNGTPNYYELRGNKMVLYPAPNYNSTNGLIFYYQRGPALYTSGEVTTGTKEPGFNSLYHRLIPLWVSYDFAMAKGKQNAAQLRQEISVLEDALKADYQERFKDEPLQIRTKYRNPR